jgi:hypothetical protein
VRHALVRAKTTVATRTNVVKASRTALAVIADDCTAFAEGAARQTQRVVDEALKRNTTGRIWLPSFSALGATDVAVSANAALSSTKGLGAIGAVGAVGGAGLIISSTLDLMRAGSAEEVLDASGDLAWGAQGLSYLSASPAVATVTTGLGFVGAVVQMSAGVLRIQRGIRLRNTHELKLGTLDVGGGILWAALDVAAWGNPLVLGSYVVLMVGREAYANKNALRKTWLFPSRSLRPTPA